MILSDLAIRRPVLSTVANLIVLLLGFIAWDRLAVREYPNIDEPVVTVSTFYPGANAQIIESQVTTPLEDSIAGIEGVDYLSSVNRAETSQISVRFTIDRDPDAAANDVRDRVARARSLLPREVEDPIVEKIESDARPIMYMAITSDRHDELELSDYADRIVKDRLEVLPGVAQLLILGERRYAMRIWLDRARLAAYRLTPADVENALRQQNVEVPSGRIESVDREFTVLSETDLRTPEQFRRIILKDADGYLVRLGDVATVEIGPEEERNMSRSSGRRAIGLGLVKQATANPLEVSRAVRAELERLDQILPEGMRVEIGFDSALFVEESIERVFITIFEAIVLVILVIFLFLRNWRATLVPLVTIPLALVGALAIMWAFGFSINTLTLLAFVLAIGLVVDDAIVMLENIYRYIEQGMTPIEAAFVGSKQIGFAIVAMTFTLAAVFTPIAFTEGKTGKLFTEFALTLAGAVIVSGFVALTLSCTLASRLLRHEVRHGALFNFGERILDAIGAGYRRALAASLRARPVVIAVMLLLGGLSVVLFRNLNAELSPVEDRGNVMGFAFAPEGATLDYLDTYTREIDRIYQSTPEVVRYMMIMGRPTVTDMISYVTLKDWGERERSAQEIAQALMPQMLAIPGVRAFTTVPPSLGGGGGLQEVQFIIMTSESYEDLDRYVEQIMARASQERALANLDTDLKLNKPEIRVDVDRDKVADAGVSVEVVGRTLETMLGGREVTRFKRNAEQYDVKLQVADVDRSDPDDLTRIYVRGAGGEMIQLSNLVRIQETVAPRELNHFNKLRSARISASVAPGYTLGQALDRLEAITYEVMGPTTQIDYEGVSREFKDSSSKIYVAFLLALAFIYLVLAAQFESFVSPLVIMFSVPLAMAGALLALNLTGASLNIYSQIGLITLVGLITKHGILIVEFSNQLRVAGVPLMEAVQQASILRLRPILMTTGAMVLGAVPLALATGAGAEARHDIGWVVVGGMTLGTVFTLFVVPTVYTYLARRMPRLAHLQAPTGAAERPVGAASGREPATGSSRPELSG
ncbi:MAG TPA: efflux RND transporter permease subunit [Pseudomonadales bacterium]